MILDTHNGLEDTACLGYAKKWSAKTVKVLVFITNRTSNCSLVMIHCIYCCILRFAFFLCLCSHKIVSTRLNKNVPGSQYIFGIMCIYKVFLLQNEHGDPPFLLQKLSSLEFNNQYAKFE